MSSVNVVSRTQRIIIDSTKRLSLSGSNRHVNIISAGPPGPQGPPGGEPAAQGVQVIPSLVWIIEHGLGYMPAGFRFFNELGQEFEPEEITYINDNRLVAQWPEPMTGSWFLS